MSELRQIAIDSIIASAMRLTGLIQKNDYGTLHDRTVTDEFERVESMIAVLPNSPTKTNVTTALNQLRSDYTLRSQNPTVDADRSASNFVAAVQTLKQVGGRKRKTRKGRGKKRSTRRRY